MKNVNILALSRMHSPCMRLFRSFKLFAPAFDNIPNDPVQKLFQEKLREYKEQSGPEGKMVDPTPQIKTELKSELERVNKQFGGDGKTDLTKFPEFKFPEVELDPIESS